MIIIKKPQLSIMRRFTATRVILVVLALTLYLTAASPAVATTNDWVSLGPDGAKVKSIALSPRISSDGNIFAGTNGAGIYKSIDTGQSWQTVNTGISNLSVYAVAISPNYGNDATVFAGTNGGGIFKSTDGGQTWSSINSGLSYKYIASLAIAPVKDETQTIYAGTNGGGVYVSSDSGQSWSKITMGIPANAIVRSIAFSPNYATDRTILVAVGDGTATIGEIYRSTDGGQTWQTDNNNLSFVGTVAISPDFANDKTAFAGTAHGAFKSTDGGYNWTRSNTGFATNTYPASFAISPDFASDSTIFAGSNGGVYKSTNRGQNWVRSSGGLTNNFAFSVAISSNKTVFAGTYGTGVFSSANPTNDGTGDGTNNWEPPVYDNPIYTEPIDPPADEDNPTPVNNPGGGGGGGGGAPEPTDIIVPATPKGLKAASGEKAVTLTWDANSDSDLAGYNVYRKAGSLSAVKLNSGLLTAPSFQDTDVQEKVNYLYYVTAVDKAGNESSPSAAIPAALTAVKAELTFSDTPASAWFAPYISKLVSEGVIGGYQDGTFKPYNKVTRGEFAKMICLAMGWDVSDSSSSFIDVPASNWASKYVTAAKRQGAIGGYPDGTFGLNNRITRAEIATIIARTLKLAPGSSSLADVRSSWAKSYIDSCVSAGIISGYPDNAFKPNNTATRAEAAKMISALLK